MCRSASQLSSSAAVLRSSIACLLDRRRRPSRGGVEQLLDRDLTFGQPLLVGVQRDCLEWPAVALDVVGPRVGAKDLPLLFLLRAIPSQVGMAGVLGVLVRFVLGLLPGLPQAGDNPLALL